MTLPFILWSLLSTSCYVVQQAGPYLSHRLQAVPVKELLAQEDLPPDTRAFLVEVQNIKTFAVEELGLISGKNYTGYVAVDTDYLAAVIQAAPEFSTDPYMFWYPILGKLPYRGYYDTDAARAFAGKLKKKGLDVFIRPVDAFSSLGFFKDPLFSFMSGYPVQKIADLIIHEETHATVFFKKYPDFNEKLATFVGTEGARQYLVRTGRSDVLAQTDEQNKGWKEFPKAVFDLDSRLDRLYQSGTGTDEMRAEKARLLSEFKEEWDLSFEVNNAFVSLYAIYDEPDNRIERVYEKAGSIPALIALYTEVLKEGGNPWDVSLP
ncbi:MAG: aminopeptidase [Spirochaetales bacterium]|nr:aminopeptidase [Spirochaetales bacterium]